MFFLHVSKQCLFHVLVSVFIFHVTGVPGWEPTNSWTTACRVRSSGNIGPFATGLNRPELRSSGKFGQSQNILCWNFGSGYIRWCLDIQIPDQDHGEYAMTRSWSSGSQSCHYKIWLLHYWLTRNPNHQRCHSSPTFLIEWEVLVSKLKMNWPSC